MENNIFFNAGDVVTLRLEIPHKPKMLVVKKETSIFKHSGKSEKPILMGIKCRWFTADGALQEGIFNTKDLIKL